VQSDSNPALSASRGARLYLALLAVLSVVACFLPLADHLGYELSELVALAAGLFGAAPGVAAARRETESSVHALWRTLRFALGALTVPVAIILINGLRRPACDRLGGLILYAAIAVPSALLSAALGLACGLVWPRRAGLLVAMIFFSTLAVALWPVVRGPQVFVFHHLGGMYPGPIYDEAIRASPALWSFRAGTVLYTAALAGVALLVGPRRPRGRGLALVLICGGGALWTSFHAERLHWRASTSRLEAELGGRLETEHLVLHFPREKKAAEQKLLARDAEVSWRAALEFLEAPLVARKIHVYLYRSADEKRRLIGAADTSFTKPWLRQIHTNDAPAPHPILRHELVHAIGAEIARGPWRVPGKWRGFLPDMALIEGVAVAADWPPGEFTVHEEARALRELGLMPDVQQLFGPGLFYAESGPRAYTTAGSFVRWLWEAKGPDVLAKLYGSYDSYKPSLDLAALSAEHARFLDSLREPARAVALAEQRFSAPPILRKRCVHEVAGLQREAAEANDPLTAMSLWAKCIEMEPDDPALLIQFARSQIAAGLLANARETQARALSHPKLSKPLRAQILTEAGDAAWRAGDVPQALARYQEAAALPQSEPAARGLAVRIRALGDPPSWPALRPLIAEGNSSPEVLLAVRDLDLARPRDGLAAYLLAKQMQNRGAWAECARFVASALARELLGPLFTQEALRMRGVAAWHLGDDAMARDAFAALGKDAPPGRALESARWLELLR
jgi:tetratricopeptide (TPR) repeat protein